MPDKGPLVPRTPISSAPSPGSSPSPNSPKALASIGVKLRVREDWELPIVTVVDPTGPAKKSGMIQENDCLMRVAGKDLHGMEAADVMPLLRGPPNSKVRIKVLRDGVTFDCTIARAVLTPEKKKKKAQRPLSENDHGNIQGPRKLSDREKADRLLRGDQHHHINRHIRGGRETRLTEHELHALREREEGVHERAQRKADQWYEDHVAADEQMRKHQIRDAALKKEPWSIMSLFEPPQKEKTWHEKALHKGAEIRTDARLALKNKIRAEKDKATAALGMAILNMKVRKAGEDIEYIMTGKRPKQGFFKGRKPDCCGFCVGARP